MVNVLLAALERFSVWKHRSVDLACIGAADRNIAAVLVAVPHIVAFHPAAARQFGQRSCGIPSARRARAGAPAV